MVETRQCTFSEFDMGMNVLAHLEIDVNKSDMVYCSVTNTTLDLYVERSWWFDTHEGLEYRGKNLWAHKIYIKAAGCPGSGSGTHSMDRDIFAIDPSLDAARPMDIDIQSDNLVHVGLDSENPANEPVDFDQDGILDQSAFYFCSLGDFADCFNTDECRKNPRTYYLENPPNCNDNCPTVPNGPLNHVDRHAEQFQKDTDNDGIGDACDSDMDNDGITNDVAALKNWSGWVWRNNCGNYLPVGGFDPPLNCQSGSFIFDPIEGAAQCCIDTCDTNREEMGDCICTNSDDDTPQTNGCVDNCPSTPNPNQSDINHDGFGDMCDWDIDGDEWQNPPGVLRKDMCVFQTEPKNGCAELCSHNENLDPILWECVVDNCLDVSNSDQADSDGDGIGNACDEN